MSVEEQLLGRIERVLLDIRDELRLARAEVPVVGDNSADRVSDRSSPFYVDKHLFHVPYDAHGKAQSYGPCSRCGEDMGFNLLPYRVGLDGKIRDAYESFPGDKLICRKCAGALRVAERYWRMYWPAAPIPTDSNRSKFQAVAKAVERLSQGIRNERKAATR